MTENQIKSARADFDKFAAEQLTILEGFIKAANATIEAIKPFDGKVLNSKVEKAVKEAVEAIGERNVNVSLRIGYNKSEFHYWKSYANSLLWLTVHDVPVKTRFVGATDRLDVEFTTAELKAAIELYETYIAKIRHNGEHFEEYCQKVSAVNEIIGDLWNDKNRSYILHLALHRYIKTPYI